MRKLHLALTMRNNGIHWDIETLFKNIPEPYRARYETPEVKKEIVMRLIEVKMMAQEAKNRKLDSKDDVKLKLALMSDQILAGYRESIDNIDAALVFMLAERFKITQAVGRYKAESGLPAADPGRESAQIERLRALAESANLDPDFSEKF